MKKIFISFLALVAIVGVANAQRTWAYDLNSTQEGDAYTFEFKATTAATTANLVLVDVNGNEVAKLPLENVVAGANSVTLELAKLHKDAVNWAVELTGEAIVAGETLAEVTDVNRGIYNFYLPQDVAVDNNPESDYFGRIYVAEATDGADDGGSERADTQKRGIFVYDQELNELNPTTNVGILPSNVTLTDQSRQALHRMSINPVNNHVAFCYNVEGASAVWSMDPANLGGDAVNLIEGLAITKATALCFDEEGALYVMDNINTIVKVVSGELTTIIQDGTWGNQDLSLVSDGRGGLWIAQNRWNIDTHSLLTHVNAAGKIDFKVTVDSPEEVKSLFPQDANASYRGQCAYNAAEDVLAFGGNKVVALFKVTYDAETGVPALEKLHVTPTLGSNIDGVAFDYAGDLYVVSASVERFYKFAVPTAENTCIVPAKSSLVITGGTATSVDNVAISVDAQKIIRNGQVLIIRDGKTFNMLGQEVK
ncbi:MAG: hypothetical protein IJX48_04265 [Paludibacteraceae bacterium]|nr:hypothetical protein [Paludibacteraceae bacterium]